MRRVLALIVVVLLPSALMIGYRVREPTPFASIELILYPLLFGGGAIAAIVLLKRYFLRGSLRDYSVSTGSIATDLLHGLGLTAVYFALFFLFRATLSGVLSSSPNLELLGLMLDMRRQPVLLLLWFGPVLWIGIALFEELTRAFLLVELWSFSSQRAWTAAAVVLAAALFGLVHWSQGSYGIVTIALKSLVAGAWYYHRRRLLPLVVAHALYDGLPVALLLLTYPES